jgi:hypothetical protein
MIFICLTMVDLPDSPEPGPGGSAIGRRLPWKVSLTQEKDLAFLSVPPSVVFDLVVDLPGMRALFTCRCSVWR